MYFEYQELIYSFLLLQVNRDERFFNQKSFEPLISKSFDAAGTLTTVELQRLKTKNNLLKKSILKFLYNVNQKIHLYY